MQFRSACFSTGLSPRMVRVMLDHLWQDKRRAWRTYRSEQPLTAACSFVLALATRLAFVVIWLTATWTDKVRRPTRLELRAGLIPRVRAVRSTQAVVILPTSSIL